MFRRYIATALIVFFFAYSAYLIVTDGGKGELVSFQKLSENIQYKINVLLGKEEFKRTPYELKQQKALDELAEKMRLEEEEEAAKQNAATPPAGSPGSNPAPGAPNPPNTSGTSGTPNTNPAPGSGGNGNS